MDPELLCTYQITQDGDTPTKLSHKLNAKLMSILDLPEGRMEAVDQTNSNDFLISSIPDGCLWDSVSLVEVYTRMKAVIAM